MTYRRAKLALALLIPLAACSPGGFGASNDGVFAPGVAGATNENGLIVGHRMMAAGEYELALKSYTRAAAQQGINPDTMSALGSANLKLGRLGQAEYWLRRAAEEEPDFPAAWNNLGVVLLEQGKYSEASEIFRRAFATDNGESDQIRENLRLALANLSDPNYDPDQQNQDFKLVRRGKGDFVILTTAP